MCVLWSGECISRIRVGVNALPSGADAARLAWDEGFIVSAERPDINDFLAALSEDLSAPSSDVPFLQS